MAATALMEGVLTAKTRRKATVLRRERSLLAARQTDPEIFKSCIHFTSLTVCTAPAPGAFPVPSRASDAELEAWRKPCHARGEKVVKSEFRRPKRLHLRQKYLQRYIIVVQERAAFPWLKLSTTHILL